MVDTNAPDSYTQLTTPERSKHFFKDAKDPRDNQMIITLKKHNNDFVESVIVKKLWNKIVDSNGQIMCGILPHTVNMAKEGYHITNMKDSGKYDTLVPRNDNNRMKAMYEFLSLPIEELVCYGEHYVRMVYSLFTMEMSNRWSEERYDKIYSVHPTDPAQWFRLRNEDGKKLFPSMKDSTYLDNGVIGMEWVDETVMEEITIKINYLIKYRIGLCFDKK